MFDTAASTLDGFSGGGISALPLTSAWQPQVQPFAAGPVVAPAPTKSDPQADSRLVEQAAKIKPQDTISASTNMATVQKEATVAEGRAPVLAAAAAAATRLSGNDPNQKADAQPAPQQGGATAMIKSMLMVHPALMALAFVAPQIAAPLAALGTAHAIGAGVASEFSRNEAKYGGSSDKSSSKLRSRDSGYVPTPSPSPAQASTMTAPRPPMDMGSVDLAGDSLKGTKLVMSEKKAEQALAKIEGLTSNNNNILKASDAALGRDRDLDNDKKAEYVPTNYGGGHPMPQAFYG